MRDTERLIEIYHEASTRPPGAERDRFLVESCGDEIGLKEQIVSLLQSHSNAGDFLKETIFPPASVTSEKLGDAIGRYKLLEKLGEGGCGVVYVAEQTEPVRRIVALKVIKLGMDTKQVIARFEAERQALAMMDHPNIARILDAGVTGHPLPSWDEGKGAGGEGRTQFSALNSQVPQGRPYFVMELVRGIRITDYCDQAILTTKERLDLFIKVCHAIQHAHQKGIIHRDIKPSNILVTLHDGVPVPKVIDFGIAKATEGRLTDNTVYTQLHQFIGTPAYMSPEQAEMSGLDIDTRSDIYSLGVLLYELLAGSTPFDAKQLMAFGVDAMRKTIRDKEPVRPSTRLATLGADELTTTAKRRSADTSKLLHQLKGDLDWIVMKCLEKDRTRRYDTANALAADLNRHLYNEPVAARPPSVAYKLQKAWRRNKLAFLSAGSIAIALLVGTALSTWLAFQARRARDLAQTERDRAKASQKAENEARRQAEDHSYVANINLAGRAWEHNNTEQLGMLLAETRTFPDRGFEWFYWQRQAHLNLATLRGHVSRINSVAFSADGRRIVTTGNDRTARVWDAATGQQLLVLIGHAREVSCAAFSSDGKWIATASDDEGVRVWDAATGRQSFKHVGHKAGVNWVAFSPDNLRIVSASHDGTAKIWEVTTDREALTFQGHTSNVLAAAFSSDGARIITGGDDRTARIWDATSAVQLLKIEGHADSILSVQFSHDGQRVLTGSTDRTARVWDALSGSNLTTVAALGPVSSANLSPDGRRLVTGGYDSRATVWDAVSGAKLLTIGAASMAVTSVAFSPDGERIVTGGGEGIAKVWEASDERQALVLRGSDSPVLAADFSPDGQRIVTAGGRVDDLAPGREAAQVWDSASGKKLFRLAGHGGGISSIAYSPDGRWILTGSGDQTARLWTAATGEEVRKYEGHTGVIRSVAFSPDSQTFVTGGGDRTAKVWDVATGRMLLNIDARGAGVRAVSFSPNGRWIVTGDWDGVVTIWDAVGGKERRRLVHSHLTRTLGLAFSRDGQRLVTCGWPRSAIVWEVETGRELFELRGHLSPVSAVAFSPDGRRIVTSGYDQCAKLWDTGTGRELLSLDDPENALNAVVFAQDGRRIVTGGWNQTARVWEAARTDQVAAWEAEERLALESRGRLKKELEVLLRERSDR